MAWRVSQRFGVQNYSSLAEGTTFWFHATSTGQISNLAAAQTYLRKQGILPSRVHPIYRSEPFPSQLGLWICTQPGLQDTDLHPPSKQSNVVDIYTLFVFFIWGWTWKVPDKMDTTLMTFHLYVQFPRCSSSFDHRFLCLINWLWRFQPTPCFSSSC